MPPASSSSSRVDVSDVSANGEFDRTGLQLFRRRRPANAARVFLAGVLGDCLLPLDGAAGEQIAHAPCERGEILGIVRLTPFSRALSSQSTSLGVGEAFLFRPHERVLFDQHTLSLVALAGTAEAHHHGLKRRVSAGSSSERGISTLEEHQVIEIGATQAERPFHLQSKKAPFRKLVAALRANRVTDDPEHDNLVSL